MLRTAFLVALLAAPASAQFNPMDDPPEPARPPAPTPSPSSPAPSLTSPAAPWSEERIEQLVNRAVARALDGRAAAAPARSDAAPSAAGPTGWVGPSAQSYAPAPAPVQYVAQPVTTVQVPVQMPTTTVQQNVRVLVPPGPIHRAMGRFGEHLSHKGDAKVRSLSLAPATATTVAAQPVVTTTMQMVAAPAPAPVPVAMPPVPAKGLASPQR